MELNTHRNLVTSSTIQLKCYAMDMLYCTLRHGDMLYARKPRSLPFSFASLISEVRSVLGVCLTKASKSTMSSLAWLG